MFLSSGIVSGTTANFIQHTVSYVFITQYSQWNKSLELQEAVVTCSLAFSNIRPRVSDGLVSRLVYVSGYIIGFHLLNWICQDMLVINLF